MAAQRNNSSPETFTWKIERFTNYSYTFFKDISLSANPNVTFRIELFPKGWANQYLIDYVLIEIHMSSSDKSTDKAQCEVAILKNNGDKFVILDGPLVHSKVGGCSNYPYALQSKVHRNYLFYSANGLLLNDTLTLQCTVFYGTQMRQHCPHGHQAVAKQTLTELETLQADNKTLLESGDLSDVTFVVQDKTFRLHKAVLASRSPVFKKMLFSEFSESKEGRVKLPELEIEVFEKLLEYIYCGVTSDIKNYAFELFMVADMYELESLKRTCSEVLVSSLSIENVASTLMLADLHNGAHLKVKCIEFISRHLKPIRTTAGWKDIVTAKRIDLVEEVLTKMNL